MTFSFVLFILLVVTFILRLPVVKGFWGELIVKIVIGKTSEKIGKEKFVINNFLMQLDTGKTSQTDHIVINSNGVFVIETKNYSGRIYGNDTQKEWTQVLNYGKVKNKFYNPVKQNATHVHLIKKLLPPQIPVYSVVVFIKGNISYIDSVYVYTLWGLSKIIKQKNTPTISLEQMKSINETLMQKNKSGTISNLEHVHNIQQTQKDIANNICPRCGATLVKRQGKNGSFLGCSNFPKCKFTKSL
jgi:hypothetical protein